MEAIFNIEKKIWSSLAKVNFETDGNACNSMMALIIAGVTAFINYSKKRTNGFTLYLFETLIHTLLLIFSVVNCKYLTISLVEYSASNFRISVSNVSGVVANKALGIIIAASLERLSLL